MTLHPANRPTNHAVGQRSIAASLSATLLLLTGVLPVSAMPIVPPASTTLSKLIQFDPPPPPDRGEPGGRGQGGASRGPCTRYASLTALVPLTRTANQAMLWGLTTSDRPTFWFYSAQGLVAGVPIELSLRDDTDKLIYKVAFNAKAAARGVFSITLPETAKALEVGKTYRWSFSIYCDPDAPDTPVTIRGGIRRVDLSAIVQRQLLREKTALGRANFYARRGIWYDALTTLGEQRQRQERPDGTIVTAWSELLKQVNLTTPAAAPIVPCCRLD